MTDLLLTQGSELFIQIMVAVAPMAIIASLVSGSVRWFTKFLRGR